MYAAELLSKVTHLTLTVDNNRSSWDDRLEFVGSYLQWREASQMEEKLYEEKFTI